MGVQEQVGIQCRLCFYCTFLLLKHHQFCTEVEGWEGTSAGPPPGHGHSLRGVYMGRGGESGPACSILLVFQCETRSMICLKWLIAISCLFFL